ncbi:DUF1604-domain-containing protein [Xylona heveae TC161]|uniref:DUF1604-domain-containing protein n=1 Tax=Xylona heveae (strain CBS 132557 / TC161) TaxID=1328760 RepID=A0A165JKY3_XYLHT|nr:DUF1604-domain-containing protein [Xylona heveae TC161]KZF26366.1 DUF1604-domain-containing protein [Xylona heveae TC161]
MATNKRSRAVYEADLQARQSPYVLYGTALPPLDPEVRDDGSYVPIWKQEVTDERGRKRLHGAFTGGFSAGYFNTVGSKEGWTPSTFVSSRTDRYKETPNNVQQRREDFMDDEDLADAAEAERLQTSTSFAGLGSTAEDTFRQGFLTDILKTAGETMGVKLLKRMGWREGQGVGPKVRRKARFHDEDDREDEQTTHLFAPDNPPMVSFDRKDDYQGLGYVGEARLSDSAGRGGSDQKDHESDSDSRLSLLREPAKKKKEKPQTRGGFGVGVLNDTGSDDEDPFEMGPRISYNRTIGGDAKKKRRSEGGLSSIGSANPLVAAKPVFISKKKAAAKSQSGFRKCHDGRLPLDGFVLAVDTSLHSSIVNQDGRYPPPKIPPDWKSAKELVTSSSTPDDNYQSVADVAKASSLDPKSRAKVLGEEQLPGKSVFDFLSASARARIASASGRSDLPAARGEAPPEGFATTQEQRQQSLQSLVPALDKGVAIQALGRGISGWMPYAEDESKRSRYRTFLEIRAGIRSGLPERAPAMSTEDWVKELHEFAHAAQIFKPMTGMMASRFTSSSTSPKVASDSEFSNSQSALLSRPEQKPEDPAESAAKMGMFGPLTRSVQQFFPTRLLCKRFNIRPPANVAPDPDMGSDTPTSGTKTTSTGIPSASLELVSKSTLDSILRESKAHRSESGETTPSGGSETPHNQPVEAPVDPEHNEALESQRAGDAMFKAIFGSDDEDDE